jgi:hypothetical protein
MITLLPRLPAPAGEQMLETMFASGKFSWAGFAADALPDGTRYAATGGSAMLPARLRVLRAELAELAAKFGFGTSEKRGDHALFDAALAPWIAGVEEFRSGEALRDDAWCFLAVAVVPDIVHWRFGASRERYLGGVRNCFQRVWLRARALDRGEDHRDRWGLVDQLTEDALVQITERPSIGADPILAHALAEGWVRTAGRIGRGRMEAVMRLAIMRLRIRNEIQALSLLHETDLADVIDIIFAAAAGQPGATCATGRQIFQPASSSSEADADDAETGPAITRKRSWAIWRAR